MRLKTEAQALALVDKRKVQWVEKRELGMYLVGQVTSVMLSCCALYG